LLLCKTIKVINTNKPVKFETCRSLMSWKVLLGTWWQMWSFFDSNYG